MQLVAQNRPFARLYSQLNLPRAYLHFAQICAVYDLIGG
jgi:hypothetical protein